MLLILISSGVGKREECGKSGMHICQQMRELYRLQRAKCCISGYGDPRDLHSVPTHSAPRSDPTPRSDPNRYFPDDDWSEPFNHRPRQAGA